MEASFAPGTLFETIRRRTRQALATGALKPIATELHEVEDGGVCFAVRVLGRHDQKRAAGVVQKQTGRDPFLPPYEEDLFVADVSPTHVALLNKFPVVENHLLVVTRAFEPQESLLEPADFAALWACMAEFDSLGFYNAGAAAGASQPHKHLQLAPLPLGGPRAAPIPVEPLLDSGKLPIEAARANLRDVRDPTDPKAGPELAAIYRELLQEVGLYEERKAPLGPYNLLLTPTWMLVVPRTRDTWGGVSVNGLGLAGALFVENTKELESLNKLGPLQALNEVGRPKESE